MINATQAQKRISDSLDKKIQEQLSKIEKIIDDAISDEKYECVLNKPVMNIIRMELERLGYKVREENGYTRISWYPANTK